MDVAAVHGQRLHRVDGDPVMTRILIHLAIAGFWLVAVVSNTVRRK